ncbi:MAG: SulP family inorganic anion transporter [Myxococcaceae bacterium]|nr:SulP family inorganic anion transporter [Myxococcaceae bacterium]
MSVSLEPVAPPPELTVAQRLRSFLTLIDSRYEDITKATWKKVLYRDMSAGLVVALTAIPMAMGFAMAMGLEPEQGIIAGAMACLVGRTFGGSKYQVYGPTAAFIPVIAGLVHKYGVASGGTAAQAHGFLVLVSIVAGVFLMISGLAGFGRYAKLVPPSVIVGFTVGIAITIAFANAGEALGIATGGGFRKTIVTIVENIGTANYWSLLLALGTFYVTRRLLKVSIFIPAPLIGLGLFTVLAGTALAGKNIVLLRDRFGPVPHNFFAFTPPSLPPVTSSVLFDLAYFAFAIYFVSAVESVLCSSMADRLAQNKGTPFDPNREFWGQGLVQVITPLINGFPCTGALARTATSIKAGAVSPMAGYFKFAFKLGIAALLASQLEHVPMACIAGILLWVASNMIKVTEIREVAATGRLNTFVMAYTAVMVPLTDFLTGVLTALVLHFVLTKLLTKRAKVQQPSASGEPA